MNEVFFDAIHAILRSLGVTEWDTYWGQEFYRFWQGTPEIPVVTQ